jgi:alpha-ketoglutarate-dependent taurine dioxygenase
MGDVLNTVLSDERAWTAETIDSVNAWYTSISDECLSELDGFVRNRNGAPESTTEIRIEKTDFPKCRQALAPVLAALQTGRGFAILDRLPMSNYTADEAQVIYWVVGQILGLPFEQDIKGTLLYDVKDTGQDVKEGARFSVTNAESSFHTDGAFNPDVPDMVGLLCLQIAKSGGESQLISGAALHNEILTNHPGVLESLYGMFCLDRRGQFLEGESPVTETPIFRWDGQELWFRYLHYYIQVGHELIDRPLIPEQLDALETMEDLIRQKKFQVEFSLEQGQMMFTNNRWILHNRTAFEDHQDVASRRHYVRLWLSMRC